MNNTENDPAVGCPLERRVGRLLLRCPKCGQEKHVDRLRTDYLEAVRIEVACPDCNAGDFAEMMQFDEDGRHITRDPDETPNVQIEGQAASGLSRSNAGLGHAVYVPANSLKIA